jgi:hypothetical protein
MHKIGEKNVLAKEALNCVEHLLILEEIGLDDYKVLNRVIELLNGKNCFNLGDGIMIELTDTKKM